MKEGPTFLNIELETLPIGVIVSSWATVLFSAILASFVLESNAALLSRVALTPQWGAHKADALSAESSGALDTHYPLWHLPVRSNAVRRIILK
jgi:hypothetical protein